MATPQRLVSIPTWLSDNSPRTFLFYPISAVITIFCNLLQNPRADGAGRDLHLLTLAETSTERVFHGHVSDSDQVIDLQPMRQFIAGLRELARGAIQR